MNQNNCKNLGKIQPSFPCPIFQPLESWPWWASHPSLVQHAAWTWTHWVSAVGESMFRQVMDGYGPFVNLFLTCFFSTGSCFWVRNGLRSPGFRRIDLQLWKFLIFWCSRSMEKVGKSDGYSHAATLCHAQTSWFPASVLSSAAARAKGCHGCKT